MPDVVHRVFQPVLLGQQRLLPNDTATWTFVADKQFEPGYRLLLRDATLFDKLALLRFQVGNRIILPLLSTSQDKPVAVPMTLLRDSIIHGPELLVGQWVQIDLCNQSIWPLNVHPSLLLQPSAIDGRYDDDLDPAFVRKIAGCCYHHHHVTGCTRCAAAATYAAAKGRLDAAKKLSEQLPDVNTVRCNKPLRANENMSYRCERALEWSNEKSAFEPHGGPHFNPSHGFWGDDETELETPSGAVGLIDLVPQQAFRPNWAPVPIEVFRALEDDKWLQQRQCELARVAAERTSKQPAATPTRAALLARAELRRLSELETEDVWASATDEWP